MRACGRQFIYKDVLPFTVMVGLECVNVGLNTIFKVATNRGMSFYVFGVYTYVLVVVLLLPFTFFYSSSLVLPAPNSRIIGKEIALGLFGSAALLCGYRGIEFGSPTLASAMSNLIPAFTFILAIICRMEKLNLRSSTSQAKVLGTVVSIIGALIIILYKGPSIIFSPQNSSNQSSNFLHASDSKWIIGGILLCIEYCVTPIWYVVQAQILNEYPSEFIVMLFYNLFAAITSGLFSYVAESNKGAWLIKPDISLVAILYSGIYECLSCCACAWILQLKGPFYIAMFEPLSIATAAVMGVMFLGDTLHVGSIIGAVTISLGFYTVMWGKAKEEIQDNLLLVTNIGSSVERTRLLE